MALRTTGAWFTALGLGLLVGCSAETVARTEIMVVVDSDLSVSSELDNLLITVAGPADKHKSAAAALGANEPALPRSLGLIHESGPLGPLEVLVEGRLSEQVVISRRAVVSFIAGRSSLLSMHLTRSCLDLACAAEQTCTELGCAAVELDSAQLPEWTGEKPTLAGGTEPLDAAVSEAGLDAGADDASTSEDASPADAATGGDASLDAGMCMPQPETCNMRDDDCDGTIDDGFDLRTDTNHCGACNTRCQQREQCCSGSCRRTCQ